MTDGMFCAKCLSQYQEILSKTRLLGTGNCLKLGRTLYFRGKCVADRHRTTYTTKILPGPSSILEGYEIASMGTKHYLLACLPSRALLLVKS